MKKLIFIPVVLIVLSVILFIGAGTPFVLHFVRQKIEETVRVNLGVPMTIGTMSGNLFFTLRVSDIEAQGLGRVEEIRIIYNPFGLLSRHVDVRSLQIDGIALDVDRLADVLADLPKKPDSSMTDSSPMKIKVEKYSITNAGLGMSMGKTPLNIVLSSSGRLLHDRVVVDSLRIETEKSVAVLKGTVPLVNGDDLDVLFNVDLAGEDLGVPGLAGDLLSTGTVTGNLSSPVITASTQASGSIHDNDITGVIDLAWVFPHFDSLDVKGGVQVRTATLQKGMVGYDTWDMKISLERTRFSTELQSKYGSMKANGMLSGEMSRPRLEGAITGRFDFEGFKPSFEGAVSYKDDILKVTRFKVKSSRVSMNLRLRYDNKIKKISDTKLSVYCKDLRVVRRLVDAPEDLSGELWFDAEVSGTPENPTAVAHMRLAQVMAFGELITGASLHASIKNNLARLDSARIESVRGVLDLQGNYDMEKGRFALHLSSGNLTFDAPTVIGADTLMLGGTVGLNIEFSGDMLNPQGQGKVTLENIVYDTLDLGDYTLEFDLADTTLRLSLSDEYSGSVLGAEAMLHGNFPFSTNIEVRHFELDRFAAPASGYVTADLTAQGYLLDLAQTRATLRIDTIELAYDSNRLHNIEPVILDVEDGVVNLHRSTLVLAGQTVHLQGTVPIDFETGHMDISGRSSDIQLSEITYFIRGSPPITGKVNFDIRIQGMPQQLDIDGNLMLEGAGYAIENVLLDSVSGRFLFKNGLVTCKAFSGKINKGRFKASGLADLSSGRLDTMVIDIELDRIDYKNRDFGSMIFSADLRAGARNDSIQIIGDVVVEEGIYDAPMKLQTFVNLLTKANRPAPQQPEMAKRIYCDIGIAVPDSIIIANNVADLAVRADLQLKGYLARLNAYGTISAISEGTVKYLGREFTIVNAVIQFDDPYKIDPFIDLTATSTISAADGDYAVSLLLNGTVASWQLELSSNPPLPQQDIVSLLLIGQRRPGEVGSTVKETDLKGKAKSYALDVVRYGIEKSGEKYLGLDKLTITGELDDPSSLRIGIEKSVTKNFTLLYATGIETWELHQIGAVYDITDHISVFTQYDQENLNTSVDLDFHFNIK